MATAVLQQLTHNAPMQLLLCGWTHGSDCPKNCFLCAFCRCAQSQVAAHSRHPPDASRLLQDLRNCIGSHALGDPAAFHDAIVDALKVVSPFRSPNSLFSLIVAQSLPCSECRPDPLVCCRDVGSPKLDIERGFWKALVYFFADLSTPAPPCGHARAPGSSTQGIIMECPRLLTLHLQRARAPNAPKYLGNGMAPLSLNFDKFGAPLGEGRAGGFRYQLRSMLEHRVTDAGQCAGHYVCYIKVCDAELEQWVRVGHDSCTRVGSVSGIVASSLVYERMLDHEQSADHSWRVLLDECVARWPLKEADEEELGPEDILEVNQLTAEWADVELYRPPGYWADALDDFHATLAQGSVHHPSVDTQPVACGPTDPRLVSLHGIETRFASISKGRAGYRTAEGDRQHEETARLVRAAREFTNLELTRRPYGVPGTPGEVRNI
ncbi:hypothetical protein B484DRAFT_484304 [Ochromonadaceae sp. CCMP2298]|nr:hypothetical protein B484DRAFT_484304 [Ochromonadaceae sp. CCMP2298]